MGTEEGVQYWQGTGGETGKGEEGGGTSTKSDELASKTDE
jgi:hypothetical protein